jgi:hypothetical protein
MEFCINAKELRKALAEIATAEDNGFKYCLAVFDIDDDVCNEFMLDNRLLTYSDLTEKAHPIDKRLDWGRHQNVSKRCKFVKDRKFPKGRLIQIKL